MRRTVIGSLSRPRLRRRLDTRIVIALSLFGTWMLLVLLSVILLPPDSVGDLSGRVLVIDNWQEYEGMNPLSKAIYLSGDVNCHQLIARSLIIKGNQMPYCARDVGIFLGLLSGAAISLLLVLRRNIVVLSLGLIPVIVDGSLQELTGYESTNLLRVVTGLIAGFSLSIFLCDAIARSDGGERLTAVSRSVHDPR